MKNSSLINIYKNMLNTNVLYYTVFLSIMFDFVVILKEDFNILFYFYDLIIMLKLNISIFLNNEGGENSLFIYLFVFYITTSIVLSFTKKLDVKHYYFLLDFFVCMLILYLLNYTLDVPRFPVKIVFPFFFILTLIVNRVKNLFFLKNLLVLSIFIIFWNFFIMFINIKEDSRIFESVFSKNRYLISSNSTFEDINSLKFWELNCCSSETYVNSGFKPGSFISNWRNKIIFVTGSGKFYTLNSNNLNQQIIKLNMLESNFFDFAKKENFESVNKISIRGVETYGDEIYVSYINESKDNCYNLSIVQGEINISGIAFESFFKPKECIEILDITNSQLHSSGGAILKHENNLYVSIGEFLESTLAQEEDNNFGKIIKFDLKNKNYETKSTGHRNIQGMVFENGSILATEHGPKGGDELNKIDLNSNELPNFGWPISSYGEHYDGKYYEDMPLFNSHSKYGFIEPLFYFTPSIGISDIKIYQNKYIISSMKSGRLYIVSKNTSGNAYNKNNLNLEKRIRDILIFNNKLLLFIEDQPGLAVLNLDN